MEDPDLICVNIMIALSDLIPGLIHVFKEDGGAKSIANFTQYETCK